MFTGIIEEIGEIAAIEPSGDGVRLSVIAPRAVEGVRPDRWDVGGAALCLIGTCIILLGPRTV